MIENYEKNELTDFQFDPKFTDQYLKILSNIYFITWRKTHLFFREEFLKKSVEFKNIREIKLKLNQIYKDNYETVRFK